MSQGAGVPEAYAASQPGIVMDDDTRPLPLGDYAIESSATVPRPTSSRGTSACGGPFTNRVLGAASHAAINGPIPARCRCAVMPQLRREAPCCIPGLAGRDSKGGSWV